MKKRVICIREAVSRKSPRVSLGSINHEACLSGSTWEVELLGEGEEGGAGKDREGEEKRVGRQGGMRGKCNVSSVSE